MAILGACALVALVVQVLFIPVDSDVSWLITVSEKVLGGARLYVDVFEVNPPASVWLYLPQVALAKAVGVRPEALIVPIMVGLALLSCVVTLRLAEGAANTSLLAAALGIATLVLPGGLFAQREHYALLLALPLCAELARIADGRSFDVRAAAASGLAGGILVVIKPHFALALALPAVFAWWRSRDIRPFLAAGIPAAAILALYLAAIWMFAPGYADRLDMLTELYIPMREHWARLLYGPVVLFPAALALLLAWLGRAGLNSLAKTLALAALGFTIAALVQGKGYWNHALPGVGLLIVAVAAQASKSGIPDDRRRLALAALAAIVMGCVSVTARIGAPPGLADALRDTAPPNPGMITLGTELRTGHPVVRLVDGRWVGSRAALFTAAGVRYRSANGRKPVSANLERWYREDLSILADEIVRGRPDVVLVERKALPWLMREPEIVTAMMPYRPARRVGEIEIWLRSDK